MSPGRRVARRPGAGRGAGGVLGSWVSALRTRLLPSARVIRVEGTLYEPRDQGGKRDEARTFHVRFEGEGKPMLIHPTRSRRYADLDGSERLPLYERFSNLVRPGRRVFELGTGTGEGAAWLRAQVGPSGGVVAVDTDRESIRYARRRWAVPALGYELGGVETLDGELDGAFELVVVWWSGPKHAPGGPTLAELWRVVGPGGALVLCTTSPEAAEARWRPDGPGRIEIDDLSPSGDGGGGGGGGGGDCGTVLSIVRPDEDAEA